jgi:formate dehydrogenase major subunit
LRFDGHNVYTTGLPYHFGPNGIVTGDVVNDLMPAGLEANVVMHEAKAFIANLEKGRVQDGSCRRRILRGATTGFVSNLC